MKIISLPADCQSRMNMLERTVERKKEPQSGQRSSSATRETQRPRSS